MSARPGFCTSEESHSILTAILERSDDAIIRTDVEDEIVGWSHGASRVYGYSAEEIVGSTVRRGKGDRLIPVSLSMLPVTDERKHVVRAPGRYAW